jgi:orotate phosphoribosyltransferase
MKKRLIELVIERTFKFSAKPTFKLVSGKTSSFYYNCKPTTLNPCKSLKIKAIGGLTLGADPVANAIAYTSYLKGDSIESFVVRKEPKKHGTMQWIEGQVKKGDKVMIVEDVITTGSSTLKAVNRAKKCGLKVQGVIVLIDRQEGGREKVEALGLPLKALLTKDEIFRVYQENKQ